mgnify:CR=1 FL=1
MTELSAVHIGLFSLQLKALGNFQRCQDGAP